MTSGRLWNYYRDEVNDSANQTDKNNMTNNNKTTTSKSFKQKTKIIGRTANNARLITVVAPFKYLS